MLRRPPERRPSAPPPWSPRTATVAAQVARLRDLKPNFDPLDLPVLARDPWHVDDYSHPLAPEAPGEPEPQGSFELARRLLLDYEFADPHRVRAFYAPDTGLAGRDMLLEIRYLFLRVRVGVRITKVFDERRQIDGRAVRVWGWAYQTLAGHLERGQMDYQIWKWLDSGDVEFRIHAVSQKAQISNPALRVGFHLVGRRQQIRFARRCGARMEHLVHEGLERGVRPHPRRVDASGTLATPSIDPAPRDHSGGSWRSRRRPSDRS